MTSSKISTPESAPSIKNLTAKLNGVSIQTPTNGAADSLGGEEKRFSMVRRKKDFKCMERVKGRLVNVLEGLELHTGVFSAAEQKRIVDYVYELQDKGRKRQLRERTYSEPKKWMRGKGRVTIQLGCCYNYATDKNGNPPGIIRDEDVDPIPPLLKSMIKRMVTWHVLPPTCIPNSCIINIYDRDDCIPPHVDHHDFVRPFCTVSFVTECNILFGAELKVLGPGEFSGSTAISLPLGSVLILKGNGADVAKHCVPAVPAKRISITFRKMDDSKLPFRFTPDPELQNLRPLPLSVNGSPIQQIDNQASVSPVQQQFQHRTPPSQAQKASGEKLVRQFDLSQDDFPSLGSSSAPVSAVQQQSQRWTPPSLAQQTSSLPRSWKSEDQNKSRDSSGPRSGNSEKLSTMGRSQSVASKEKPVIPFDLSQDDFPSLGSSSSMRKLGRFLRQ